MQEATKIETGCVPCAIGHLGTCSGLLNEAIRFAGKDGMDSEEVIDRVGLLDKSYRRADRLSGGEQQRVGIARALMQEPEILLADEPIASLDPMIAFNILSLVKEISLEDNITVICCLHQVDFAILQRVAD